jgi:hypothetical protein
MKGMVEKTAHLHPSQNMIKIIKVKRMRWVGHVAQMGERTAYRLLVRNSEEKRPL